MVKKWKGAVGLLSLIVVLMMIMCLVPTMALASNTVAVTDADYADGKVTLVGTMAPGADVTLLALIGFEGSLEDVEEPDDIQPYIVYIDQFPADANGDWTKEFIPREGVTGNSIRIFLGGEDVESPLELDPIPLSSGYTVSGYVDVPAAVGATVTLDGASVETGENGYFEIENVADGTYDLVISAKSALPRTISVTVDGENVAVSSSDSKITLMFGDINEDEIINVTDLVLVKGKFNKESSDGEYDVNCDLNNDGIINVTDLVTIKGNFNKESKDY